MTAGDLVTRGDVEAMLGTVADRIVDRVVAALRGPVWVTVEQAASVLCCTPATIRSRCRGGDLQSRRVGRKILVSADSLRGHTQAEVDAAARLAREARS